MSEEAKPCPHTDPLVIDGQTAWCADCGAIYAMQTWRLPKRRREYDPEAGGAWEIDALRAADELRHAGLRFTRPAEEKKT